MTIKKKAKYLKYRSGKISEKTFVEFELKWQGDDLIVTISGGAAHIGSLAYSSDIKGSTPKIIQYTYPTHREDQIVRQAVEALVDLVPGNLLVVGGIHYDDISKDQISVIVHHCRSILDRILVDLKEL